MEKIFVHVFIVASSLQLFMTASSLPLPLTTDCDCDNKPVVVNGNLLSNWLDPRNDESRISTIAMKADDVLDYIKNVSTQGLLGCHSTYDLKLKYDRSQKVTHDLIKQFYNGLILYQQFIEYLTNQEIKHILKTNLANITGGLDHNIARLYHLLNITGCDCMQRNCSQTEEQLESLIDKTNKCSTNRKISGAALRIIDDVDNLRMIFTKLHNDGSTQEGQHHNNDHNTNQHSYSFSTIKATMTSDGKWCHLM